MAGSSVGTANPEDLTLVNVRDGTVKLNVLKKAQLQELCNTFIAHIGRLKLELEKNKAPHNVSTIDNKTFKLRAELKELEFKFVYIFSLRQAIHGLQTKETDDTCNLPIKSLSSGPHVAVKVAQERWQMPELKELKEAVFVDGTGANACGDVPVGLMQV
jgi:hypothetical protein